MHIIHFLFSETNTVQITVNEPTLILEFLINQEPDVAHFTQSWLNQIEEGLIEIIDGKKCRVNTL